MLVLARKKNQSIIINDDIEILIVDINVEQVKLGIKAPKNVSIHRKEIYETIKAEMAHAAESSENISALKNLPQIPGKKNSGE